MDQQQQQQQAGQVNKEQLLLDLRQMFARGQDEEFDGLTPGFLEGVRHQRLVRGRAPRHRGVCLGRVARVTRRGVLVRLMSPVKRGDGVVFDQGSPESEEEGGSVYDIIAVGDDRPVTRAVTVTSSSVTPPSSRRGQQQAGRRGDGGAREAGSTNKGGMTNTVTNAEGGRRVEGVAAAGTMVELVFGDGQVDTRLVKVGFC